MAATAVVLAGPVSAGAAPQPPGGLSVAQSGCGTAATTSLPDGKLIVVELPPAPSFTVGQIPSAWWRSTPSEDPTWQMTFRGLMWAKALAARAAQDDQWDSVDALVGQAATFYRQNPDPGDNRYGWDEGTSLRRLQVMNCLYALTKDPRLVPGIQADVAVNLGPRYYGPPRFSVHNHGLMANLAIVRAGELLHREDWKSTAVDRMKAEAPEAFSPQGFTWEQSSMYHKVNVVLWTEAARQVEAAGYSSSAASIRAVTTKAADAYAWMTTPDGDIAQVGDSDEGPGYIRRDWTSRMIRDDAAGWVIGKWSWTDPDTTHYTLRYGPPRRAHGQYDQGGGLTWTTGGHRVLVSPGRYNYDLTNHYSHWRSTPAAQNVAVPVGGTLNNRRGTLKAGLVRAPAHSWVVTDSIWTDGQGGTSWPHTRSVNVYRDTRSLRVADSYQGPSSWRQYWHLDPAWSLVSRSADGTKAVFEDGGAKLTVTTTGRVTGVLRGQTSPVAGWHFPRFNEREAANEVVIRSYGTACTTTFQLTT